MLSSDAVAAMTAFVRDNEKPFGASPSVLIVHDDEPKGFDTVIRRLAQLKTAILRCITRKARLEPKPNVQVVRDFGTGRV